MKFATAAVLMYAAYCAALFFLQRQILFPVSLIPAGPLPVFSGITMETLRTGDDDEMVEHLLLPPAPGTSRGAAPLIIFCHGNAEIKEYALNEMLPFTRLGMAVLLVEYPGYGGFSGSPSQQTITRVLIAAYDAMIQRPDIDADRIVLIGRSLGGAAACQLAARRETAAMILVSTFTGVTAFTRRYLIPDFLVRDPFDSLSIVETYPGPILVIHGRTDDIVPVDHGAALARAAPKATLVLYDCGHNDLPPDRQIWLADITRFLGENGIIDSGGIYTETEKTRPNAETGGTEKSDMETQ